MDKPRKRQLANRGGKRKAVENKCMAIFSKGIKARSRYWYIGNLMIWRHFQPSGAERRNAADRVFSFKWCGSKCWHAWVTNLKQTFSTIQSSDLIKLSVESRSPERSSAHGPPKVRASFRWSCSRPIPEPPFKQRLWKNLMQIHSWQFSLRIDPWIRRPVRMSPQLMPGVKVTIFETEFSKPVCRKHYTRKPQTSRAATEDSRCRTFEMAPWEASSSHPLVEIDAIALQDLLRGDNAIHPSYISVPSLHLEAEPSPDLWRPLTDVGLACLLELSSSRKAVDMPVGRNTGFERHPSKPSMVRISSLGGEASSEVLHWYVLQT